MGAVCGGYGPAEPAGIPLAEFRCATRDMEEMGPGGPAQASRAKGLAWERARPRVTGVAGPKALMPGCYAGGIRKLRYDTYRCLPSLRHRC